MFCGPSLPALLFVGSYIFSFAYVEGEMLELFLSLFWVLVYALYSFGHVVSVHPIVKWMVTFLQMEACDGTLPLIAYISVAQAILNYCGFLCLVPLVPEMASDLGMSSAVAGLILSAPTFGQVFATPT